MSASKKKTKRSKGSAGLIKYFWAAHGMAALDMDGGPMHYYRGLETDVEVKRLRQRLHDVAEIIENVDRRCSAVDGPVTPTLDEMKQSEISLIYKLSKDLDGPDPCA